LKILKFQEKRAKIINISCKKKVVLRNVENFEVLIYILIKKDMSAEDDIFLAEESPIDDRRK
jgi:hypothetical protein